MTVMVKMIDCGFLVDHGFGLCSGWVLRLLALLARVVRAGARLVVLREVALREVVLRAAALLAVAVRAVAVRGGMPKTVLA
jgi:hypothetical protein